MLEAVPTVQELGLNPDSLSSLETGIKYEGYIKLALEDAQRLQKAEMVLIPEEIDYSSIQGLALEAREKLSAVRPKTLGQAERIPGVNPADCAALLLALKRMKNEL